MEVGILSGFSLYPGAAAPTDLIRKVEILPEKVILYLGSVSVLSCHHFMVRHEKLSSATLLIICRIRFDFELNIDYIKTV